MVFLNNICPLSKSLQVFRVIFSKSNLNETLSTHCGKIPFATAVFRTFLQPPVKSKSRLPLQKNGSLLFDMIQEHLHSFQRAGAIRNETGKSAISDRRRTKSLPAADSEYI